MTASSEQKKIEKTGRKRRTPWGLLSDLFFNVCAYIGIIGGFPFEWLVFRRKIYYEDKSIQSRHIKGGALIISNHYNPWDFVAQVFQVFPRKLYVVCSEYGFTTPFRRFGMRFWGGIQADRPNKDMSFVRVSADLIKEGKLVLIFPEGHNTPDGTIKSFYPSYLSIAFKSGRPIIPIVTDGKFWPNERLRVIVGKPIYLSELMDDPERYTKAEVERLNGIVRAKVLELRARLDEYAKAERKK